VIAVAGDGHGHGAPLEAEAEQLESRQVQAEGDLHRPFFGCELHACSAHAARAVDFEAHGGAFGRRGDPIAIPGHGDMAGRH
jgi:hypothetical protein